MTAETASPCGDIVRCCDVRSVATSRMAFRCPQPTRDQTWTTAILSTRTSVLRRSLPIVFAVSTLALMTTHARAAELDKLSIDTPVVKVIGRDMATDAPIEDVTVVARVTPDPQTLTTDSGVALLNDYVHEAA